jgi:hypothetical protein
MILMCMCVDWVVVVLSISASCYRMPNRQRGKRQPAGRGRGRGAPIRRPTLREMREDADRGRLPPADYFMHNLMLASNDRAEVLDTLLASVRVARSQRNDRWRRTVAREAMVLEYMPDHWIQRNIYDIPPVPRGGGRPRTDRDRQADLVDIRLETNPDLGRLSSGAGNPEAETTSDARSRSRHRGSPSRSRSARHRTPDRRQRSPRRDARSRRLQSESPRREVRRPQSRSPRRESRRPQSTSPQHEFRCPESRAPRRESRSSARLYRTESMASTTSFSTHPPHETTTPKPTEPTTSKPTGPAGI